MRFSPLTPARLAAELAQWIGDLDAEHPLIGFDGAAEIGAVGLADLVATQLAGLGRPVIRVSTSWWWRPASLRLELGRTDVDMLLGGWVDSAALRRELFDPLAAGGSGCYLQRLRDPETDRSVRDPRVAVSPRAAVLLDGPFLTAAGLPLGATVYLQVSPATFARSLAPDRRWWIEAFERYLAQDRPAESADVVIAYDHAAAPAIAWRS